MENVYKLTLILRWLFKRSKNMSQQNDLSRKENFQAIVDSSVNLPKDNRKNESSKKQKDDSEEALYLTRI